MNLKWLLMIVSCSAFGDDFSKCSDTFVKGTAPTPTITSIDLCYTSFAVSYDKSRKVPIYAAEHLTDKDVIAAHILDRKDAFHSEVRLSKDDRSLLSDYDKSGYDRGHMAPFGDMPDAKSGYESFSLVNIVPQNSIKNRRIWERIETNVRGIAMANKSVYIVTGPIFKGESKYLNNRVGIPNSFFKAIFVDSLNKGVVFISDNVDDGKFSTMSIYSFEKTYGMNVFPSISKTNKKTVLPLSDL